MRLSLLHWQRPGPLLEKNSRETTSWRLKSRQRVWIVFLCLRWRVAAVNSWMSVRGLWPHVWQLPHFPFRSFGHHCWSLCLDQTLDHLKHLRRGLFDCRDWTIETGLVQNWRHSPDWSFLLWYLLGLWCVLFALMCFVQRFLKVSCMHPPMNERNGCDGHSCQKLRCSHQGRLAKRHFWINCPKGHHSSCRDKV